MSQTNRYDLLREAKLDELRQLKQKRLQRPLVHVARSQPPSSLHDAEESVVSEQPENLNTLQTDVRDQRKIAEETRKRCVLAETELQSYRLKAQLLEEEIQKHKEEVKLYEEYSNGTQDQETESELSILVEDIQNLKNLIAQTRREKLEFRSQLRDLWNEHTSVKENTELRRKELEVERQHLLQQADKKPQNNKHEQELAKILKEKEDALGQLCTARQEVDTLMHIVQEKEEIIQVMERNHDELWKENEALLEALDSSVGPAEPPPEVSSLYTPIVDIYPQFNQNTRNLMADVGSTGSSFAKEYEETKEVQYASPDPTENLLHQSTGETTVQDIEYGAATPPQEQIYDESGQETPTHVWEWEERPRTPPRDQRTPRTSGASTPHRDSFERTSSPQIFNLISSQNIQHIEEPEDFFSQMISEDSNRRGYDTIPESLFD